MTTPDPREIAKEMILDRAKDIDTMAIGEFIWVPGAELPPDEHDARCEEIDAEITSAVVTVTFPGDPGTDTAAQLIRHFADKIDQGPDVPLSPSVYSALARETADALDGRKPESEDV